MIKDVKVENNVLEYKGFKFDKTAVTFDLEKMLQAQGQQEEALSVFKKLFGGDGTMTMYYGSDGKRIASIMASSIDELKAKLDAALAGGTGSVGQSPGYKAVRSRLPDEVGALFLLNAQEVVKQIAQLVATVTGGEFQAPTDIPKEAAFLGGSFAATPAGYRFDIVVPSTVGPVFEKGFGTMFQALQGQVRD
jgi:hypothetical protein